MPSPPSDRKTLEQYDDVCATIRLLARIFTFHGRSKGRHKSRCPDFVGANLRAARSLTHSGLDGLHPPIPTFAAHRPLSRPEWDLETSQHRPILGCRRLLNCFTMEMRLHRGRDSVNQRGNIHIGRQVHAGENQIPRLGAHRFCHQSGISIRALIAHDHNFI